MTWAMEVIVKATVALLAAGAVSALLRRQPAATRHLVWATAVGSLVALPALAWLLPAWQAEAVQIPLGLTATGGTAGGTGSFGGAALLWTVWAAGALVVLTRMAVAAATVRRMARRSRPLGTRGGVRLIEGAENGSPMAWGLMRPVIWLPAGASRWPADLKRRVLLHEMAHQRRLDWVTQMMGNLACALYWFHPLVWAAVNQMWQQSEAACDDAVLRAGAPADGYAENLLWVARALRRPAAPALAAVAMAGPGPLEGRLRAILDPGRSRRGTSRGWITTAILTAACLVAPVAAMRPAAAQGGGKVYKAGESVVAPRLISKVEPQYTEEAKHAKIEGSVELAIEVWPDGCAHNIRVLRGIDSGLDENAVKALEQWRFSPGQKDGKPVKVPATVVINFRLL